MSAGEANPDKAALKALLADAEFAASQVPHLDGPVGHVGSGPAWRSTMARRVHEHTLAPTATTVRNALRDLVDDLAALHQSTPAELPEKKD